MIEISQNRKDLAKLFKGVGVEVGVERAVFSYHIAQTASTLYCVDPWKTIPGYREHVSQESLNAFFEEAQERMEMFDCRFIRKLSLEAVQAFPDESLDFVYIDADHQYKSVQDDIREWAKKVKVGGIVSGHDYVKGSGVAKAVDELNKEVTIWRGDKSPSWSYIK